ncbi:MAG: hypothetical protein ABFS45_09485 [Pseudomonadota bacterium]
MSEVNDRSFVRQLRPHDAKNSYNNWLEMSAVGQNWTFSSNKKRRPEGRR